jgi:hypothetical protein
MEPRDMDFLDGVCDLGERLLGDEPDRLRVAALLVLAARKVLTDGAEVDEEAFDDAVDAAIALDSARREDLN